MTKDAKKAQKKAAKEAGKGFKDSFKDTVRSVKSAGKTLVNATGIRKKAKEKGESYVGGYILGEVTQTVAAAGAAAAAGKGLKGAKAAKKTKPKKKNGLADTGSKTSYGKSSGKYDTTADFLTNIENRNGKFYTDKATIDKIGQVEARGEDFSLLNKRIMSSRASTEGGTSVVYKYSDELGTKYLIHEVTDARGYIIHRDFDAVRISSGQLINKGH